MREKALRLICVDDDPVCIANLRHALEPARTELVKQFFTVPQEALEAHRRSPADIVISDLRMNGMSGIALISEMQRHHPDALYLLLSGDADLEAALAAVNDIHAFRFLTKPASPEQLQLALDAAITEINLRKLRRISLVSHAAVQRLRAPILFLNERLQLLYSNAAADGLLASGGLFEIGHDRVLRTKRQRETGELHTLLESIRKSADGDEARHLFRFDAAGEAGPVVASIAFHPQAGSEEAYYSILLSDPGASRTTSDSIAIALNILPSEARIVHAIAEGATVEDAARRAGVSLSSARTYLKSVFLKTGVARQSELVRLVLLTAA